MSTAMLWNFVNDGDVKKREGKPQGLLQNDFNNFSKEACFKLITF